MQAMGSVLLRPGKLKVAAKAAPNTTTIDDALNIVVRLGIDKATGGDLAQIIGEAFADQFTTMLEDIGDDLETAQQHLLEWIQPFLTSVQTLGEALPETNDAGDVVNSGKAFFELFADVAESLTPAGLRAIIARGVEIATEDLGITNAYLEQQVMALLDAIITRLANAPAEADATKRANRKSVVQSLRRLKRQIQGQLTIPPLNVISLVEPLIEWLRQTGFAEVMQKVACVCRNIEAGMDVAAALAELVPFTGMGTGSVGAGGGGPNPPEKAFYPSWLMGKLVKTNELSAHPDLGKVTYNVISQDAMEKFAFHSEWIMLATEGLLQITSIEQGDYALNITQSLYAIIALLVTVIGKDEIPWWAYFLLMKFLTIWLTALEGRTLGQFDALQYFFRLLSDLVATYLFAYWPRALREHLLSFFTLLNHDGSETAINRDYIFGMILPFIEAGTWITAAIVPHNLFAFPAVPKVLPYWLLAGLGINIAGFLTGFAISSAISRRPATTKGFFTAWGISLPFTLLNFIFYWWLINDGNTDDGKIGYMPDGSDQGATVAFAGYPDKATSPYKLPYEKDKNEECVQGNHGIFSHHNGGAFQTYAFDFSLKLGQDVLCMRDGTVVFVREDIADGERPNDNANQVIVRHITAANPNPNADHDKDVNGAVVVTYTRYLHGKQGTISPNVSVGDEVTQGQKLMECDHTGISAFNHIHVHVEPEDPSTVIGATVLTSTFNRKGYSIPFVFSDVDGNGVPTSFNDYTSGNG